MTQPASSSRANGLSDAALFNGVVGICLVIGYLLSILGANHLDLPRFLLITALNVGWFALYHQVECVTSPAARRWWAAALVALSMAMMMVTLVQGELDWLVAVTIIGVMAIAESMRVAIAIAALSFIVPLAQARIFYPQDTISSLFTLLPAYIFVIIFVYLARRQMDLREHAETLLAELTASKSALEAAHAQLQAYAGAVEELAVTRERNRVAREIHDPLGHFLTMLSGKLETAVHMQARGDERLSGEIGEALRLSKECLAEVRQSVATLRPSDPTAASFSGAIGVLAATFEASCPGVAVTVDCDGPAQALSPEIRVALYRCCQEALTNIRKYAGATKVLLCLRVDGGHAELTVLDNGRGASARSDGHTPGYGIIGMRERLALLGGTIAAGPAKDLGWRVDASVPLRAEARYAADGRSPQEVLDAAS